MTVRKLKIFSRHFKTFKAENLLQHGFTVGDTVADTVGDTVRGHSQGTQSGDTVRDGVWETG